MGSRRPRSQSVSVTQAKPAHRGGGTSSSQQRNHDVAETEQQRQIRLLVRQDRAVDLCTDRSDDGGTVGSIDEAAEAMAFEEDENGEIVLDGVKTRLTPAQIAQIQAAEIRADQWLMEVEGLDPYNEDDLRVIYSSKSVGAKTRLQYISHYRQLRKEGLPISYRGLADFLIRRRSGMKTSSYNHWVTAINFYHEIYGLAGDQSQMLRVSKGLRRCDPRNAITRRGGIEHTMLVDLLQKKWLPKEYRDYFILLHATGVRGNQLARFRLSDFTKRADGVLYYVVCQKNFKGMGRAMKRDDGLELHESLAYWTEELDRILAAAKAKAADGEDPWLAPTWNAVEGNNYVKRGAKELKWNDKLVWVVHSFRHGRAIEAAVEGEGLEDAARREILFRATNHKTASMSKLYSTGNVQRDLEETAKREVQYRRGVFAGVNIPVFTVAGAKLRGKMVRF